MSMDLLGIANIEILAGTVADEHDWQEVAKTLNRKERYVYAEMIKMNINPLIFASPTMHEIENWLEMGIVLDAEEVTI